MGRNERKLLGQRIKQIRETQGYTQAELARHFDLTETDVRKIEEGSFTSELIDILSSLFRVLENSILKSWTKHRHEMWSNGNKEQAGSDWPREAGYS
jgi:transcriptional regulator with XRE-family HTH domain